MQIMKDHAPRIRELPYLDPSQDIVRNINPALVDRRWKQRCRLMRRRFLGLPPTAA